MSDFPPPVVAWSGAQQDDAPLVVLLHGRGSNERDIIGLADLLPAGASYAAVRAPIGEGGGYAWFANRGIGRPVAGSLRASIDWFRGWLDEVALDTRPVLLVGFSGGGAFAGGVALDDPGRIAGLATLYATLPWDAGVPTTPSRLAGLSVLAVQGDADTVIPPELQRRSWDYLHSDSGAKLTAKRSHGGHGLTSDDVDALASWITEQLG